MGPLAQPCFRLSLLDGSDRRGGRIVVQSSTRDSAFDSHPKFRHLFCPFKMPETEAPFRPREKLIEKQKYFQAIHRHTYLKGPYDKITSVAIPLALAGTSLYMIGRGVYHMSCGIGKKE